MFVSVTEISRTLTSRRRPPRFDRKIGHSRKVLPDRDAPQEAELAWLGSQWGSTLG
jgi:hypothetical protein